MLALNVAFLNLRYRRLRIWVQYIRVCTILSQQSISIIFYPLARKILLKEVSFTGFPNSSIYWTKTPRNARSRTDSGMLSKQIFEKCSERKICWQLCCSFFYSFCRSYFQKNLVTCLLMKSFAIQTEFKYLWPINH